MNKVRAVGLAVLGAVLAVVPARAQLARVRTPSADAPKLLVVPFQRDNVDSTLSLLIADGVRERLRSDHLDKFNVITRAQLCTALTESGYPCDVPLDGNAVRQLLRFMNSKLVIEANIIRRGTDSVLVVARLSEAIGTDPQSAGASVMAAVARAGTSTGSDLVRGLVAGYQTFDEVTECRHKLDARDFAGALQKANQALRQFPNNAGAWVCIARIREAQTAPEAEVIAALDSAYRRDTLNTNIMHRLAAKYEAAHDTANMVSMLKRILDIDFRDPDLRIGTARILVQMGQLDTAIAIIEKGLQQNPASSELLGVKAIAIGSKAQRCAQAADSVPAGAARDSAKTRCSPLWLEAATSLATVADIDSTKMDSLFFTRITNYLRAAPDTNKWITWVQKATIKLPTQLDYWYTLASVRMVKGDSAGAEQAARGLLAQLPGSLDSLTTVASRGYFARGHYVLAMLMQGHGQADSALAHIDPAVRADSTIRPQAAVVYLQAGLKSYRDSAYAVAIERLQKAKDYATGRAVVPAAFFLGVSQVQSLRQLDAATETSHSCDDVKKLVDGWAAAEQNIIAGAAQNRETANLLLSQVIPAYKQRAGAFTRNFHCPAS